MHTILIAHRDGAFAEQLGSVLQVRSLLAAVAEPTAVRELSLAFSR